MRTANWEALTSPCLRGKIFLGLELRKKPSQICCFNGRRGPLAVPASSLALTAARRNASRAFKVFDCDNLPLHKDL